MTWMMQYTRTDHGTLRDPMTGHEYPPDYPPGLFPALDEAWTILDALKPGVLSVESRSLLAGMITGAIDRAKREGKS